MAEAACCVASRIMRLKKLRSIPGAKIPNMKRSFSNVSRANMSSDLEHDVYVMKKEIKSGLVKALANVIEVQKYLQSRTKFPNTIDSTVDEQESSWKRSLDSYIAENEIECCIKTFLNAPVLELNHPSGDLLVTYMNLLGVLLNDKTKFLVAFDVLIQFENSYQIIEHEGGMDVESKYKHIKKATLTKFFKALGELDSKQITSHKLTHVLNELFAIVHAMPEPFEQHIYFPNLMRAMLNLSFRPIKMQKVEIEVWEAALSSLQRNTKEISSDRSILENYGWLLSMSTFRKQQDLPFSMLLKLLVKMGYRPSQSVVLNILHNDFPFSQLFSIRDLMSILIRLQYQKLENDLNYEIDIGTLEHACGVLARKGSSSDLISIWEYIDNIRNSGNILYKPSEGMYELLAQSFASSTKKEDHLLFGVLANMEADGFKPSFNFIRGLAQAMRSRSTIHRLDNCLFILRSKHDGIQATVSALNCIMSAFADLGMIEKTYSVYEMFDYLKCEPNIDTFKFMMEAIHMNLSTAIPRSRKNVKIDSDGQEWIASQLNAAEVIMDVASDKGFGMDNQLVDVYVRILLDAGEVDKASVFVENVINDFLTRKELPPISRGTFKAIAQEYSSVGNTANVNFIEHLYLNAGYNVKLSL